MENEKVLDNLKEENNLEENIADKTSASEDNVTSENNNTPEKKGFLRELYEWTQAIAVAVVLALFINQFVFSIVEVQGSSMEPTLLENERLFVFKPFYKPKNTDIVIVWSDQLNKYIVKRVIATEGQTIDFDEETGAVYIDGELQNEPYIKEGINYYVGDADNYPLKIPKNHVFVMGDNRGNSMDSRALGVIENSDVIGKAVFRLWPFDSMGGLYGNLE